MGHQSRSSGSGALSAAERAQDLLKEVTTIFITSTIVCLRSNNREGTALPINGKLDEKFMEHGPNHQNKTQFTPQSISAIKKLP